MKLPTFRNKLDRANGETRFYKVIVGALALLAFLQTAVIFAQLDNERVIVVPPEIDKTFWVEKGRVSKDYLEQMTLFITQLQLTVSPVTHDFQTKKILAYVHPSAHGKMQSDMMAAGAALKANNMSTWFHPQQLMTSEKSNRVAIGGKLVTYVGEKETSNKTVMYRAQYTYVSGRLYLTMFEEVTNNDPFDAQKTNVIRTPGAGA